MWMLEIRANDDPHALYFDEGTFEPLAQVALYTELDKLERQGFHCVPLFDEGQPVAATSNRWFACRAARDGWDYLEVTLRRRDCVAN